VLAVFEEIAGGILVLRMLKRYDRLEFHKQEMELEALLEVLPIARLSIDNTGIGMNLAENLKRRHSQVVPEDFSTHTKEVWATDFKIGLQRKMIELPKDRALISEIHSIKKSVTPAGRVTFEAEQQSKGHGDAFWACALAARKERGEVQRTASVNVRVFG
jgi:phage FluMu gp28-like protein